MGNENGTWIMRGLPLSDPRCIRSPEELTDYITKVGFLPLFRNGIRDFSVEEFTDAAAWWTGDQSRDPWEWREILARSGKVVYGKFFGKIAGFLSTDWLPYVVNYRRNGYDFDALWDDEKASFRQKKIMDLFETEPELFSNDLKAKAGFGKDGDRNFEGTVTGLQMSLYLCVRDFRQRTNKAGTPYGWPIAVYCTPEHIWGKEAVTAAYSEDPNVSGERICRHVSELYGVQNEKTLHSLLY